MLSAVMFVTLMSVFQGCCAADAQPVAPAANAQPAAPAQLTWITNYEEAVQQAKTTQKPILLFFTGSGWCPACERLEKEVFTTPEFAQAAGGQFVFVKLDFPRNGNSKDPRLDAQNNQLMNKYSVRGFPTVILLDSQQQKIGVTGYRPGGAQAFASHLQKMVSDYKTYKHGVSLMQSQKVQGKQLKSLFEKAHSLDLKEDELAIIKAGVESDQKIFFQIEQYRALADEGLIHAPEAVALKQQLLAEDPTNAQKTHYYVAVIEFEAFSNEMEKENYSPELAVAPLVNYLERFGTQDKQNKWRLQMIISQVFLDKNKLALALRYAQSSYEAAPATVQPEIATAIRNLKSQSEMQ